jgi:hypothetical protein
MGVVSYGLAVYTLFQMSQPGVVFSDLKDTARPSLKQ